MAKCVLVIDDSRLIQRNLEQWLTKADYKVITCGEPTKAMDIALESSPDLIILDYLMPDIDGLELAEQFSNNEATLDIPKLMITANQTKELKMDAMQFNVRGFLNKPMDKEKVLLKVKQLIDPAN